MRTQSTVFAKELQLHKTCIDVPILRPQSSFVTQEPGGADRQKGISPITQEPGSNLTSTSRSTDTQEHVVENSLVQIETMILENDMFK